MLSFMNARKSKETAEPDSVEDKVYSIQQGNLSLREQFILDYKPFILKCATKFTNNFIGTENSDEFSIALIAFNESINAFKLVKGMSFLSFSELVIRNRLLDNARRNKNEKNVLPFVSLETRSDEGKIEPYDIGTEDPSFSRLELIDQIKAFSKSLKEYGIQFNDLVKCSPKHQDSRNRMITLARVIYENKTLLDKLKRTRGIPIRELLEITKVYRGTIEQNRKYIIALVLILDSRLDMLKSYLDSTYRGGGQYAN